MRRSIVFDTYMNFWYKQLRIGIHKCPARESRFGKESTKLVNPLNYRFWLPVSGKSGCRILKSMALHCVQPYIRMPLIKFMAVQPEVWIPASKSMVVQPGIQIVSPRADLFSSTLSCNRKEEKNHQTSHFARARPFQSTRQLCARALLSINQATVRALAPSSQ